LTNTYHGLTHNHRPHTLTLPIFILLYLQVQSVIRLRPSSNVLWILYYDIFIDNLQDIDYTLTMLAVVYNLLEVLIVLVPILLAVAFMTIIERKVLAAMQRRVGPNKVGYYGVLQPFADALKLVVKETVIPAQATKSLFFLAPVITLIFSLLGWGVIPFGAGLALSDFSLGILYTLAISSVGVYGVLFAGWSANSKYAFLGSLRSTAQMISYELILSSAILTVILLTGSFNIITIIENQESVWFVVPLLPMFIIFFISALAETNRTPFDLPEAESELVAGFFTEHSGMIFVFFFLGEYCSIVLMSTLTAILFFGGYNMPELFVNDTFINLQSIVLGLKTCMFCFLFVWFRATLPRLRYDQLMVFCWTGMLPLAIGLIVLVPSILVAFDIAPY
jgi:NADH-ubiquinone oxidoreductase chain 1